MKLILIIMAFTFSLNASAYTVIGSLLENKQILEFIAKEKQTGFTLTSVLDRLANEGLNEDQRGARGHYLLKLKKVEYRDNEDGETERNEISRRFDVRTDFGRVQSIDEVIENPVAPINPIDGPQ